MRIILISSTWTDGVRSLERLMRLSAKLLATLASHSAKTSSAPSLIRSSSVRRRPPKLDGKAESSAAIVGSSRPRMLSAAIAQAESDTTLHDERVADHGWSGG